MRTMPAVPLQAHAVYCLKPFKRLCLAFMVEVGRFARAVRHHYGDARDCPARGYWLSYQSGPGSDPQLQRLKYAGGKQAAKKKSRATTEAFGCRYINQIKAQRPPCPRCYLC
eukprot:scaffold388452_cov48-Prasinocladus_malaysianus.AAC.2